MMTSKLLPKSGLIYSPNPEDSEKLLKQLLESVKECQKRYGGKTELATEFDNCVAALCLSLEAVFLHGLRSKPIETTPNSSTFKQVSEIVTNTLHISNEPPSFWPFVCKHLTQHEKERYAVLKHIWTDTGCAKAFIRSALNERSLERYCNTLTKNQEILNVYYEDWALLRDQEKSNLLPNMAAGLGSILFAVNIDKPELNSVASQKRIILRENSEPIIEAPVVDHKIKKHKKVARQFISFDNEDHTEMPSSSPSSSTSSCLSENTKLSEQAANVKEEKTSNLEESKSKSNVARKKSVEDSGKFVMNVPQTLKPLSSSGIGELTPVSVEYQNLDSSQLLDDNCELPTDISAVLSAVETQNNEQAQKQQETIETFKKENESLKEQVKKYVSAIQMLNNKENVELDLKNVGVDLENMGLNPQPDYKSEAKIFEKKLVQVAEMHAELMDFNVHLQQQLSKKEALVDRLKTELEILRGPMQIDDFYLDSSYNVNIWIPSAFLTGSGSNSYHVYQIFIRAGSDEWNIYRRYAQFYVLHTDLKHIDPVVATFDFPKKKSIGKKDSALVEDRRKRLQVYLRRILTHWSELSHCNSKALLEQHLPFFKDPKDDNKSKKSIFSNSRGAENTRDNHYTGL